MIGPDSSPLARDMADERLDAAVEAVQREMAVLEKFWARMRAIFGFSPVDAAEAVQTAEKLAVAQELLRQRSPKLLDDLQRWLPFIELKLAEGVPGWQTTATELARLARAAGAREFEQAAQDCAACDGGHAGCAALLTRLKGLQS